jgi:hypothetical protein
VGEWFVGVNVVNRVPHGGGGVMVWAGMVNPVLYRGEDQGQNCALQSGGSWSILCSTEWRIMVNTVLYRVEDQGQVRQCPPWLALAMCTGLPWQCRNSSPTF